MRRISAMYQYSGGTKYNHNCGECRNCVESIQRKKVVHKCIRYAAIGGPETAWNPSWIACKLFSGQAAEKKQDEDAVEGQLSFEDFPEVMP